MILSWIKVKEQYHSFEVKMSPTPSRWESAAGNRSGDILFLLKEETTPNTLDR